MLSISRTFKELLKLQRTERGVGTFNKLVDEIISKKQQIQLNKRS